MRRVRGYFSMSRLSRAVGILDKIKKRCKVVRGDEGSTLVEFALSCSVLCMVLFGIVQVSLLVYSYDFVSEAARDGARYAIVRGTRCTALPDCNATSAQIQTHVQSLSYPGITTSNLTVTAIWYKAATAPPNMTWSTCTVSPCNVIGNAVNVTVQYPFQLTIPFWGTSSVNLSNSSQMVMAQ
jgi:Flp pilus assembly protein TadG